MKKNGFTLVELIATIIIIGLVIIIAIPVYNNMTGKTQEKAYVNKIKSIEVAAANYAADFKNELKVSTEKVCVSINTLIKENLLASDGKNELYLTNPYPTGKEKDEYLTGSVVLKYENEEITTKYDLEGNCGVHVSKKTNNDDKYEIDITPPTGSMEIIEGDFTNKTTIHLKLTLPDADAAYFCHKDVKEGECLIYYELSKYNPSNISYNLANNVEGNHNVYLWLKDKYGNVSEPLEDNILYDKTPPTGTIIINGDEKSRYTNNPKVDLTFTYNDKSPASGVELMCVSNTSTCPDADWEAVKPSKQWSLTDYEGDQTVTVWFKDKAKNVSLAYPKTIMLDTVKPTDGTININNNQPYTNNKKVTLTLSSTDATSKLGHMCVSLTPDCPKTDWVNYATTHTIDLQGADGEKFVYVKFRDNALNESNTINDTIILDTTSPVVSFSPAPGTYTKPQTIKVTITEINYDKMNIQVNNSVGKVDALSKDGITTKEHSVYLDRHTKWTVYAKSTDLAGNRQLTPPLNTYNWTSAEYILNLEYTLTYNNNSGSGCTNKKIIHNEAYGSLCGSKRAGYGFTSWNTAANGSGNTITETTTVKVVDNQTIYAQWKICSSGTYNDGTSSSCIPCPTGYTSNEGATAITACYMTVVDGKHLKTANDPDGTICPASTYKKEHVVNYGQTSSCITCAKGEFSAAGSKQCSTCPDGYKDGVATTAKNLCIKSVPAANRVAEAGGEATGCGTGYYKAKHDVKYGQTSTCDQCDAGYRDGAAVGLRSDCIKSVPAANRVAEAGGAATSCGTGYYNAKHDVKYGQTSTCDQCDAGYRDGVAVGLRSDCIKSVSAGNKVASVGGSATSCGTGYYKAKHDVKYGQTSSCDLCPTDFTSDAGSGAITNCYFTVSAGYYKNSLNTKSQAACGKGTYNISHKGYYGTNTSCTDCVSGYRDGDGTTAQTECIMNVSGGNHVAALYATSASICGANTYKPAHSVKYGAKSDCIDCGSGKTSPAGSTSASACQAACTKYWEQNGEPTYNYKSSHCSGVPTSLPSVNDYNEGDTVSVCTSYKYYICNSWYQDPKPSGCKSRYYESCSSCGGLADSLGARAKKTPYILKCQ